MAVSNVKAVFRCGIQTVWDTVTSLTDYGWRSDLSRIEVLSETQFVEYTKDGFATTFTITAAEPCRRWEFELENGNLKGRWTGVFSEKDGGTEIEFMEEVTTKKWWLKPLVKGYLTKQQARYIADLRRALPL